AGGFEKAPSGGQGQRERSDDGVACAGYVDGLVRPENGKVACRMVRLKQCHAIAPASHQQGLEPLATEKPSPQIVKALQVISNRLAESSLQLGFVGRGRGQVLVSREVVAGVDGDGQPTALCPPAKRIHFLGVSDAV